MTIKLIGLTFHVHHQVLVEYCTDYEGRAEFIRENKPPDEIPVRLARMQIIPPERMSQGLTAAVADFVALRDKAAALRDKAAALRVKTAALWVKGNALWVKAVALEDKAVALWDDLIADFAPELKALHAELCPYCPWDGHTLFPGKGD